MMRRNKLNIKSRQQQQGVVIIVALFIVALIAAMSYAMMARLERDIQRTTLLLRNTQAQLYAQGAVEWAMAQLRNDIEQQANQVIDKIPLELPVQVINGYRISTTIYDMQGRFNLNNLTQNADEQVNFKRLLQIVAPTLSDEQAQEIVLAVVDWLDPEAQQSAYSQYYLELPQPYRAAHRPMLSTGELRLVKGMTDALFEALEPYLTALPKTTKINVQTAEAPVLMLLNPTMTLETATAIEQARLETPFVSLYQFLNVDAVKTQSINTGKITFLSEYFLIETKVSIEDQELVLYTLVERIVKDRKVIFAILSSSSH